MRLEGQNPSISPKKESSADNKSGTNRSKQGLNAENIAKTSKSKKDMITESNIMPKKDARTDHSRQNSHNSREEPGPHAISRNPKYLGSQPNIF